MPLLILRLVLVAGAMACVVKVAQSAEATLASAAVVAQETAQPFLLLACAILVIAVVMALNQLRR